MKKRLIFIIIIVIALFIIAFNLFDISISKKVIKFDNVIIQKPSYFRFYNKSNFILNDKFIEYFNRTTLKKKKEM